MNSTYLLLFFFAHWVGDFLLQTSEMAIQKATSVKWLTFHVATYSLVLFLFSIPILPWQQIGLFILVNAILHWVTDFFTSKLVLKYRAQPKIFYTVIGFDQFIHYSSLVLTYYVVTLR